MYEQSLEPIEFNKKTLFDKLMPIIKFSKSLVDKFEVELADHDQNVDLVKVGECITNFIDQMRMAYALYTKNHNDIAEQVKKVCQNLPHVKHFDYNSLRFKNFLFKIKISISPTQ